MQLLNQSSSKKKTGMAPKCVDSQNVKIKYSENVWGLQNTTN